MYQVLFQPHKEYTECITENIYNYNKRQLTINGENKEEKPPQPKTQFTRDSLIPRKPWGGDWNGCDLNGAQGSDYKVVPPQRSTKFRCVTLEGQLCYDWQNTGNPLSQSSRVRNTRGGLQRHVIYTLRVSKAWKMKSTDMLTKKSDRINM